MARRRLGEFAATKDDRRWLLKEIATIAEKAYRRGFQQGFLSARGELGGQEKTKPLLEPGEEPVPVPTPKQVNDWRFAENWKRYAVGPPGSLSAGHRLSLVARLRCELVAEVHPSITQLVFEFDDEFPGAI